MNIGYLTSQDTQNANGEIIKRITGVIYIPFLQPQSISLIQIGTQAKSKNQNMPDFHITYGVSKEHLKTQQIIGAFWKKISKNGIEYLSGYITSPLFLNGRIYIAGFTPMNSESGLAYELKWTKHDKKDDTSLQGQVATEKSEPEYLPDYDIA